MISYVKTTVLVLFLLCGTKLLQAEDVQSIDKLKSSNDSEEVEHKANISESSILKSLDKVENRTENVDKTAENSTKGGDEKEQSDLEEEIKTAEEKKGEHSLRRKRSHVSRIKEKYQQSRSEDGLEDSGEDKPSSNSGSSGEDENDSDSNSSEEDSSDEDNTIPPKGHDDFLNFLRVFLDDSCALVESYSNLHNSLEKILVLINESEVGGELDTDAIMSLLSKFKEIWEEYCDSPRNTKNALTVFYDVVSKITKFTNLYEPDEELDSDSQPSYDPSAVLMGLLNANGDNMRRSFGPQLLSTVVNGLTGSQKKTEAKQEKDFMSVFTELFETYGGLLGIPPPIRVIIVTMIKSLVSGKRSDNALDMLTAIFDTYGGGLNLTDDVKSVITLLQGLGGGKGGHTTQSKGGPSLFGMLSNYDGNDPKETELARRFQYEGPSLEEVLQKFCELSLKSNDIITILKTLLKEFHVNDEPDNGRNENVYSMKFLKSLKPIVDKNSDITERSGYEATLIKGVMEKYCEGFKRSKSALTKVLVPHEGGNTKRSALLSSRPLLDKYIDDSKRKVDPLDYLKYVLAKCCGLPVPETKKLDSGDESIDLQRIQTKKSVRPEVKTKTNKIHSMSEERQRKRTKYNDMIGWRHGVFEPDKSQNVSKTQTEKSSPRIIKKTKIRKLKKPKNLKNRLLHLYNGKENDTRTRDHKGQFPKARIIGHKENPSSSFEVKTGVEKDMGSNDSNPRFRCNVRTKASMSDADGRTGSSKGHTFSEIPSNDTKALLCSSETSEVQRPNKDVYIKQSVSGKSIVSYDNPDKYIRHNYSPSKENLEIGTSGFSALNDTSSKNQSISVVSTDSQNADSISRSETKFVEGKGSSRGMESSANVEGSIDAVPNKNPFITNSKQHSLGMIVENPDKNMESPLPVEKNEKLQTYSKFERTEDFDINFRKFDPERPRPEFHHRPRPR